MRIGFDAKRLFFNCTGLGVYSRLLVKGLSQLDPEMQLLLFARQAAKSEFYRDFQDCKIISSSALLWRSWRMTRDIVKHNCQIFHGLSHELPFGIHRTNTKTIVTIHDVIFRVYPGLYPRLDRKFYHQKWKYSSRVSDLIVAVSQQTKDDLCLFYDVNPEKVRIIPPPVSLTGHPIDTAVFKQEEKLPKDFLLFVGALNKRKNIGVILEAYNIMKQSDRIPLVIVGTGPQKDALLHLIKRYKLNQFVIFKDHVSQAKLSSYYQSAMALIYPSLYEGFGIPIVEALRNKTPVITSNISSMPEAAGPGGLLIDPRDGKQLSEAILKIRDDENLRNKLAEAGFKHSLNFLPEEICNRQIKLYQELIGNEKAGK